MIDRTMKAVSAVSAPEELVNIHWNGVAELLPVYDYLAVSRRGVDPPYFLITRSSRFTEHLNPWTQRDRLAGELVGEIRLRQSARHHRRPPGQSRVYPDAALAGGPAAECIARIRTAVTASSGNAPPLNDQTLVAPPCQ